MKQADLKEGVTYFGQYGNTRKPGRNRKVIRIAHGDVEYEITYASGVTGRHSCFISTFLNWAKGVVKDAG